MRVVGTPESDLHPGLFAAAAAYPLWFALVFWLAPAAAPIRYWGLGLAVELLVLLTGVFAVKRLGSSTKRRRIIRQSIMVLVLISCLLSTRAMSHYSITWGAGLIAGLIGVGLSASVRRGWRRPRKYILLVLFGVCFAAIVLSVVGRATAALLLYYAAALVAAAAGLSVFAAGRRGSR